MDWLCCFVKDEGRAEIIDFAVFSVCATRTGLADKMIVLMCAVFPVPRLPASYLRRWILRCFCNIKTIVHILAETQFK